MFTKRLWICLAAGAVLGVVCIVGALIRSGFDSEIYYLFSLWFNRLVMGLVIGAPWKRSSLPVTLARGAVLGLVVSFAFYSSVGFTDVISFLMGIAYGIIIEYVAYRFNGVKK